VATTIETAEDGGFSTATLGTQAASQRASDRSEGGGGSTMATNAAIALVVVQE
jgi:hypothetical protein